MFAIDSNLMKISTSIKNYDAIKKTEVHNENKLYQGDNNIKEQYIHFTSIGWFAVI